VNDKSMTGDDQLDWQLITLAVVQSDFDLDKAAKRLKASNWPGGKRRIADALARWEAQISNVERTTRDPENAPRDARIAREHSQDPHFSRLSGAHVARPTLTTDSPTIGRLVLRVIAWVAFILIPLGIALAWLCVALVAGALMEVSQ
jgi:hypothetical protein